MSHKNQDKINLTLSGELQKLSTSIFIGYQTKFFSLLQNGTKIAYKNLDDKDFPLENTFLIRDCAVCEAEQQFSFTLETPKRVYTLKAKDEPTRLVWMRTITQLRKQIIRKKFKGNNNKKKQIQKPKILPSSTQNTLPNFSLSFLHQTMPSIKTSNLAQTQRSIRQSSRLANPEKDQQIKKDFSSLLNMIPEFYLKYNIYIVALKNKVENLFTATFTESVYILFSSKSLYRQSAEEMMDDNLTNMMLPPWAQVNKIYKVANSTQTPKLLLELSKIIDIEQPKEQKTCIKLRTVETVHSFYCKTVEEKDRLKEKFQIAIQNYKQVMINGKLTRKNYDRLMFLHNHQSEQFIHALQDIVDGFKPKEHKFQPSIIIKSIDVVISWIQELVLILGNKRQNCSEIIIKVLKEVHDEIKVQIKLTWDSSYSAMKGQDILKFLNALAAYHSVIKAHITDIEFMNGMKELSKIYVRLAWNNFEDIILGIVDQEKKKNIFIDEDNEYIETNGIVDLFKFIYEVFELAAPCWEHKLHLHNVQKLMCRAISVFICELKSAVDETVIPNQQLIAITNNYFRFSITVDQFYNQKFKDLQEKTKEAYQKLKSDYKQLSNIILDKLAFDIRVSIKKFLEKSIFFKVDVQKICQILKQSSQTIQINSFHPIFIKRFYEKIFTAVRQGILCLIQKEVSSKKKQNVKKILDAVDSLSFDLVEISKLLFNGKTKIDKELNEVNILLSCQNHNEILKMIKGAEEDIKRIYLNLLNLRQDYFTGAPLYYLLNEDAAERSSVALTSNNLQVKNSIRPTRLTISREREMRASFSSYYIANDFDSYSSASKSDHEYDEPLRLISEGYLMKCKTNKKVWQKEFFRLKNGTLYFYQNQSSQKCQNSVSVSDMINVYSNTSNEGLNFTIEYTSLNRQKTIQFKCESVELRDRWVESISLELRRVKNDEKVKRQKLKLNQPKKKYLIIDYQELTNGKDYFSYTGTQ